MAPTPGTEYYNPQSSTGKYNAAKSDRLQRLLDESRAGQQQEGETPSTPDTGVTGGPVTGLSARLSKKDPYDGMS